MPAGRPPVKAEAELARTAYAAVRMSVSIRSKSRLRAKQKVDRWPGRGTAGRRQRTRATSIEQDTSSSSGMTWGSSTPITSTPRTAGAASSLTTPSDSPRLRQSAHAVCASTQNLA